MTRTSLALVIALSAAGCNNSSVGGVVNPTSADGGTPAGVVDMAVPDMPMQHNGGDPPPDGGLPDAAPKPPPPSDGGTFTNPPPSDNPVQHAPPTPVNAQNLLPGQNVWDVSVDQGGGIWAATSSTIYYFPPGKSTPFTYDQKNGLARGQYQWTDTWFSPGTYPVTFSAVAGAAPGEVIIGEQGTIGDRLQVNPSTGAVIKIDNMAVTMAQVQGSEYPEHLKRVVAVWHAVVDMNGTFSGTAYLGGFHGFYAFHGLANDCGCLNFEEHQHYITSSDVYGDDVKGLAITSTGDVFTGDRDVVTLLPQRSKGATTGFFDYDISTAVDVFPGVRDEIYGIATDAQDGLYVASDGNGLAYLAPATHAASYWSSATTLPQNHLRGVAVDGKGNAWVGTYQAGVARFNPSSNSWTYYTQSSGLSSDTIHNVYFDKLNTNGKIYLATDNGISIVTP